MRSPLAFYSMRVLAVGLVIVAVMGVLRGFFQGFSNMIPTAVSKVVEQIVNAIISVVGAYILISMGNRYALERAEPSLGMAYGAAGGTLGTTIGALAGFLFLVFIYFINRKFVKRQIAKDRTRHRESTKRLLKILILTSIPVILSSVIMNVTTLIDMGIFNQVLANQGVDAAERAAMVGMFSGKYKIMITLPLAMVTGLSTSILPSLSAAVATGKKDDAFLRISQSVRFTMLVAIHCFIGYVALASPIMVVLFNDPEPMPAQMLMMGAISVVFFSWSAILSTVLQGLDRMKLPVINAAISLAIHIVVLLFMLIVLEWHVYALVLSNVVFAAAMWFFNARSLKKAAGYRQEYIKPIVKPLLSSLVMGIVAFAIHYLLNRAIGGRVLPTLVAIIFGAMVYLIVLLKSGAMSRHDVFALPKGSKIMGLLEKVHLAPRR